MKSINILFSQAFCALALNACQNNYNPNIQMTDDSSVCIFNDTIHDFGTISIDNPVDSFDFYCVNNTNSPIVIFDVKTSCECTKAKFSTAPISPSDSSYVRVIYDGTGKSSSHFSKSVKVFSNVTLKPITLHVEGEVK